MVTKLSVARVVPRLVCIANQKRMKENVQMIKVSKKLSPLRRKMVGSDAILAMHSLSLVLVATI